MTLDELRRQQVEGSEEADIFLEEDLDAEQLQSDLIEALRTLDAIHALLLWVAAGPRHLSNYKLREIKRLRKEASDLLEQHGYSFDEEEEEG